MSKLFFDHLVEMKKIDKEIRKIAKTPEEREEIWALVDEMVHHKVMGCILDKLPRPHHEEFLEIYHKSPHDEELLFGYLKTKTGGDMKDSIKKEIDVLNEELLKEIGTSK
jgi:3-dehydroquinate dehydratase